MILEPQRWIKSVKGLLLKTLIEFKIPSAHLGKRCNCWRCSIRRVEKHSQAIFAVDYGYRLRSPSAYGQPRSYGSYGGYEQLPTRYGYGAQERGMYDPTARYISGTGEGGYMPGDNPQFMGDNHYMGGEGSRFMGGEGSGMMSAGSGMMGGGSGMMGGGGFMGASQFAGEGGPGGGDGLEDMFKMQAEMQQMQRQMMRGPPAVAKDKGNTTTNAVRIGENILVTNQVRLILRCTGVIVRPLFTNVRSNCTFYLQTLVPQNATWSYVALAKS